MLDLDFEPTKVTNGLFVSKARVVPDVKGMFLLSVMNVSEADIHINGRKVLGHVNKIGETLSAIPTEHVNSLKT